MPDISWPLPERPDLRDSLLDTYRNRSGYHDDRHLAEVLARIGELSGPDGAGRALALAAWFHDAVYEGDRDDEERSAALAETSLADAGMDPGEIAEVVRLVRLTATHAPEPGDGAGAILCDADLGILAATPERYREYADGVRTDYAHIDDPGFVEGRIAVLGDLLARDTLFHTEYARTHWEDAARANLAAEMSALQSTPVG